MSHPSAGFFYAPTRSSTAVAPSGYRYNARMGMFPATGRIEVVDDVIARILAAKTPAERVAMIGDAHDTARALVAAGTRLRHPSWTESEIAADVARRMLGDAT